MRDIDCRSFMLRLQENFATRSKPRVQATVAASCSFLESTSNALIYRAKTKLLGFLFVTKLAKFNFQFQDDPARGRMGPRLHSLAL